MRLLEEKYENKTALEICQAEMDELKSCIPDKRLLNDSVQEFNHLYNRTSTSED